MAGSQNDAPGQWLCAPRDCSCSGCERAISAGEFVVRDRSAADGFWCHVCAKTKTTRRN